MFILILLLRLIGVACVFGAVMIHMELGLGWVLFNDAAKNPNFAMPALVICAVVLFILAGFLDARRKQRSK